MDEKQLKALASAALAVGGILRLTGSLAPKAIIRWLAWSAEGVALVAAAALLTIHYFRKGHDLVAAGFLVFAVGEGLILSGAATGLGAGLPSFGAGAGLWAASLILISAPPVFPLFVRILGFLAAALLGVTALLIFAGRYILPITAPLPLYAYPFFVATLFGWIWTLMRERSKSS